MEKKMKILIAEDEALTAMVLTAEFKNLGYDVCNPVATAMSAIETAGQEKPDIIFMDIHLSGDMNGIEAAKKIISIYDTRIVFMTGYSREEIDEEMKEVKNFTYLTKPIQISEMEKIINDIMKDKFSD